MCLAQVGKYLYDQSKINHTLYGITQKPKIPDKHFIVYPIRDGLTEDADLKDGIMLDRVKCEAFICCFSKAKDQLDMWRYYSKTEDGYSLGFDTSLLFYEQERYKFTETIESKVKFPNLKRLDVLYTPEEKQKYMETTLIRASRCFDDLMTEKGKEAAEKELELFVGYLVQENEYRFKHECFKNEKEFRFVSYRPIMKPKRMNNDIPEIRYRKQQGVLIPYIEIPCSKDALQSIQISPFVRSGFSHSANVGLLQNYLEKQGFARVSVSQSELPVRF